MEKHTYHFHDGKKGSAILVRVRRRAAQSKIINLTSDGTLIIELAGDPDEETINKKLVSLLSASLKVNVSQIEIVAGSNKNEKLISILDIDPMKLQDKISDLI